MDEYDEAVLFTYALLESRLERLEYLLSGPKKSGDEKPQTIPDRIRRIETSLQQLAGKTALLDNVTELCTHHYMDAMYFEADCSSDKTQGRSHPPVFYRRCHPSLYTSKVPPRG